MIQIYITEEPIEAFENQQFKVEAFGACVEFLGAIRPEENGLVINGIEYEAYQEMAEKTMHQKLEEIRVESGFLAAEVVHRVGRIRVGEAAIRVRVWSSHRKEAYEANMKFMEELKRDVPIWKVATF